MNRLDQVNTTTALYTTLAIVCSTLATVCTLFVG
jgi:hypothetical protein